MYQPARRVDEFNIETATSYLYELIFHIIIHYN